MAHYVTLLKYRIFFIFSDDCSFVEEISLDFEQTADDLLLYCCSKLGDHFDARNCCFKTIGEDSYIFGKHKLVDFAYLHEHICINSLPNLILTCVNAVEVEKVANGVYVLLDRDMQLFNSSDLGPNISELTHKPGLHQNGGHSPRHHSVLFSGETEKPFTIFIESLNLLRHAENNVSYEIQLGLFHGSKRLCPTITKYIKGPSRNNHIANFSEQMVGN